jgi:hypothetical protein
MTRRQAQKLWLGALVVAVGCGGGSGGPEPDDGGPDAPSVGSGTNMLSGPSAFPVRAAWMDPAEPASQCGADAVTSGGYAATSIVLFENDESSLACADGGLSRGGSGRFVDIQVGTLQYITLQTSSANPPPATQALTPGVYPILNERENQENLCSVPVTTPISVLEVQQFGLYDAQQIAISGTVTIESVGPRSIVGTFSVLLGGPYGQTDGGPGQPLSGSFGTTACP